MSPPNNELQRTRAAVSLQHVPGELPASQCRRAPLSFWPLGGRDFLNRQEHVLVRRRGMGIIGRVLAGLVLVGFAGIGVANVLNPDPFIARSGVSKGGELLTAWNRLGFRIAGAVFTAVALYMLYHLILD